MIEIPILLAAVFGLIYARAPVSVWTIALGCLLLALTILGHPHWIFLTLAWLIFLAATGFVLLKRFRIQFFTQPLFSKLQKQMPSISDTEREAIEAGNVWWEKDLFCGKPNWETFLKMPPPALSSEEQSFLAQQVETLCDMLNDWQIVYQDHDLTPATWAYLKQEKFFGMVIPKEYGGHGFSALAHSTIVVKIATRSVSAAVNTMVPNSLGPAELLLHYGTSAQKDFYLPRLARGEEIPCFALTGPEAGSDAGAITDTGVICRGMHDGQEVLGMRLSWDKRYITLAPVATLLGIAFKLYDPDHLLGSIEDLGITLCLVPASHPGVEIGTRHLPLRLAFMNGPTRGKDVFIPLDWIIGGVEMAGQGWKMLMECLSIGRAISLPALSTACNKLAYFTTGAYANVRKQFNLPIAHFEGVEEALANIAGYTYLLEACRQTTVGAVDQKIRPSIVSAIAKYHMTELARQSIAHAMDIQAGSAIQMGPRNLLAHAHFAIPVSITVEGANILTRNLIIFGQGAIRCHPYVLQEVEYLSAKNPDVEKLDRTLLSHVGYFMSHVMRNIAFGLTGGHCIFVSEKGVMARYFKQLTRMSTALALLSDVSLMLLGGQLKRKERISARLGDILSQLYLASTVLKYFYDQGKPASDIDYVQWCVETCLHKIQIACEELCDNFPNRWLGNVLQRFIFPWGRSYRKPSDLLSHTIANAMTIPSACRERLMRYCYIGKTSDEPTYRFASALKQLSDLQPTMKKFQTALRSGTVSRQENFTTQLQSAVAANVVTAEEASALLEYEMLRREIIKVDEFSFDLKNVIT